VLYSPLPENDTAEKLAWLMTSSEAAIVEIGAVRALAG
jgi:hypothetical protein